MLCMDAEAEGPLDDVLRAFVAVGINEEVREALARIQAGLKRTAARVSWVAPANVHLTLVFLGNIFAAQVEQLGSALDAVVSAFQPFSFDVAGAGTFGPSNAPRVVWVGVEDPSGALMALQARVAQAVRDRGFNLEARAFRPHLTLGRVRARRGASDLTSHLQSFKSIRCGRVDVKRVLLMRSRLGPHGAVYSTLHEACLKGE